MRTITKRQHEILMFIRASSKTNGYAPSIPEITKHFGLGSIATVHKHLKYLVNKGFLVHEPYSKRGYVEPE